MPRQSILQSGRLCCGSISRLLPPRAMDRVERPVPSRGQAMPLTPNQVISGSVSKRRWAMSSRACSG